MDVIDYKEMVQGRIQELMPRLGELADYIHQHPEYNYQEFKSSAAVADCLNQLGFAVEHGYCGLETAVRAVYDSGKPGLNLGFIGEYDAVPGMGHSCGHNLMTPIAIGAAWALKPLADQFGGKITVIGAPAEEGGGGKIVMLERGGFDGLDTAMLIHSASETVVNDISYSRTDVIVDFYGKTSHAATWPEEGVSALTPVLELFNIIQALRLEIADRGKIIGIISKGGEEPIYIPDHCQAKFTVRSFSMKYKWELYHRLIDICSHLAAITGTRFEHQIDGYTYEDIRNNEVLEELLQANFQALGEPVMPRRKELGIGCTDMGDVTHKVPGLQSYIKVVPDLRGHTKEFEDACGSPAGYRAIEVAAKALAMSGADLFTDPRAIERVRRAFREMKAKYE
ncbi:MAG: M20 family metallopeptidase [Clostridiales bacterium]